MAKCDIFRWGNIYRPSNSLKYFISISLILFHGTGSNGHDSIEWGSCLSKSLQKAGADCGMLEVPLNYLEQNSTKIKIALSRLRHNVTIEKYQGIILMNPGGPGLSGLNIILTKSSLPQHVADAYDWIGFDPRGVGQSQPTISCIANHLVGPRPDYVARNANEERYWKDKARKYMNACLKSYSESLPFLGTLNVVRDMDRIRIAFNQEEINYIGYSYGTYLAQVYVSLYPSRMRRVVLDGVVDPRKVWFKSILEQPRDFDRNFNFWFDWLAKNNNYYSLGERVCEVREKWTNILESTRQQPIAGKIGPSDWLEAFFQVAYSRKLWPHMANIFTTVYNTNTNNQTTINISQILNPPVDDNSYAILISIISNDARGYRNLNLLKELFWWSYTQAPLTAWRSCRFFLPSLYWPFKFGKQFTVRDRRKIPMLLITSDLDAATPMANAFEARKRFRKARLVVVENELTHGISLDGNQCVDQIIANYLESGRLPSRNTKKNIDFVCSQSFEPQPAVTPKTRFRSFPTFI